MGTSWYEDDEFWRVAGPLLFSVGRRSGTRDEVDSLVALLELERGAKILDLCCGIGRHSIELARRGFRVTAVDRTRQFLEIARSSAEEANVEIEFVESDMRSFRRPDAFDGAINLFSSFGYFEDETDDERVARNLAVSLKPRGVLVLETMCKEVIARDFEERSWLEEEGTFLLQERAIAEEFSRIVNRWIVVPREGGPIELDFSHRIYSAVELGSLFRGCGFSTTRAMGSLDGSAFDQRAERLVLIAER
jgi:SAM-dependent methyltransferase